MLVSQVNVIYYLIYTKKKKEIKGEGERQREIEREQIEKLYKFYFQK